MDIPPPPPPMDLSVILGDLEIKLKEGTTDAHTIQHRFGQQYIRSRSVIDALFAKYEQKVSYQRLSERRVQQIVEENKLRSVFNKSRQHVHTIKRFLQRFQDRETDFIINEAKFAHLQAKVDNILTDLKIAIDNETESISSHSNSDTSDTDSHSGENEESDDGSVGEADSVSDDESSSDSDICCENYIGDRYSMHKHDFKGLLKTFFTLNVQRDNYILIKYVYDKSNGE